MLLSIISEQISFLAFFVTIFSFIVDLSSKPVLIRVEKSRKAFSSIVSSTLALLVNENDPWII